jgi:DNA-binding response OmpR family regulator
MHMAAEGLHRILHVDDDRDIRDIVRLALEEKRGYSVESCASTGEALECARAFRPDLLILDMIMPGKDGLELYQAIRAIDGLAEVPVMFMTSAAQTIDMRAYAHAGAIGTIMKPFDYATLAEMVEEIWDSRNDQADPA